jgi:hypothetical protein
VAISETYNRQAALLVRVIPLVAEETCFALKGGTAINLFVRDMPHEHRRFLLSCKKCKPEWELLGIPHADQLPAVQWRLQNLAKADAKKREKLVGDLLMALRIEG